MNHGGIIVLHRDSQDFIVSKIVAQHDSWSSLTLCDGQGRDVFLLHEFHILEQLMFRVRDLSERRSHGGRAITPLCIYASVQIEHRCPGHRGLHTLDGGIAGRHVRADHCHIEGLQTFRADGLSSHVDGGHLGLGISLEGGEHSVIGTIIKIGHLRSRSYVAFINHKEREVYTTSNHNKLNVHRVGLIGNDLPFVGHLAQ